MQSNIHAQVHVNQLRRDVRPLANAPVNKFIKQAKSKLAIWVLCVRSSGGIKLASEDSICTAFAIPREAKILDNAKGMPLADNATATLASKDRSTILVMILKWQFSMRFHWRSVASGK